jgi:hypothetical protein
MASALTSNSAASTSTTRLGLAAIDDRSFVTPSSGISSAAANAFTSISWALVAVLDRSSRRAFTPAQATKQRSRLMRWLVAHQGWYFCPILLLLGLSMHDEAIRGLISPAKTQRRWVEIGFLTLRLGGLALLVFLVLSPEEPRVPRCAAGCIRPVHGLLVRA